MNKKVFKCIKKYLDPFPFKQRKKIYLRGSFSYEFIYHFLSQSLSDNQCEALLIDAAKTFNPYDLKEKVKERILV